MENNVEMEKALAIAWRDRDAWQRRRQIELCVREAQERDVRQIKAEVERQKA